MAQIPKNIYEVIAARKEAAGQEPVSKAIQRQYFPKGKPQAPKYTGVDPEGYEALKKKTAPEATAPAAKES
jgi:hypothetical protein